MKHFYKRIRLFLRIVYRVWDSQETMFGKYGLVVIRISPALAWEVSGYVWPWKA